VPAKQHRPSFVIRSTAPNYYKVLGVAPVATSAQIKAAYYDLCWLHHPDRGGDADTMAQVTEAYGVLSSAERRKAYDAKRRFLHKPCSTCKGEGVTYRTVGFTKRSTTPCRTCGGTGTQGGA